MLKLAAGLFILLSMTMTETSVRLRPLEKLSIPPMPRLIPLEAVALAEEKLPTLWLANSSVAADTEEGEGAWEVAPTLPLF